MENKEAFEKRLEAQLDEWDAEVRRLKATAEKAQASARVQYFKNIEELEAMQEKAKKRLEEIQRANETAWQDLRAGAEAAWEDMVTAVKVARSRFKN